MSRTKANLVLVCSALLIGCAPPVDDELISYFGAPEQDLAVAKNAVEICGNTSPKAREEAFRNIGFVNATFVNSERSIDDVDGLLLIEPESDVVVKLGQDGGVSGCIVGLKGMSPEQSFNLALIWVRKFGAVSNTELGQGLTPNAIEAWRFRGDGFPIFIAAYKTWDLLEEPGAAVRLSH
ncbi:hypothetical protein SAMN05444003_1580 [Cognatiyoonia sediminum]|uniref:Lipoprotein n=1 Tax=Cognatiyoonia sediminum TaxID=1508389 RepID=A0A1M5NT68_9RHOB|nr:hypothetical protein [Cognatiyoonia sediminum]SHG92667.1 hypothetical protein SAMN05444003_1580 [Cognatiyoonia sediminum]